MRLMRGMMLVSLCWACAGLMSCREETPDSETPQTATSTLTHPGVDTGTQVGMAPLPIVLPVPKTKGTPPNLEGVENLEPDNQMLRPDFLAPLEVKNVALNQPVTALTDPPVMGELSQIVDGDKEAVEDSCVDLGPMRQWVQIDLGSVHELWAILFWHNHSQKYVCFDVVVQVADDPDFITNVRTLFNNDHDNSIGLGAGPDKNYRETHEGKLIDAKKEKAQYVRLYSNGNVANDRNEYTEVEVYGRPVP